jgi:peptidoglycan/xylan/chitin deacetylase (PgdA/CDA1 family)
MHLLKSISGTAMAVLLLAAATGCNNGAGDKKAGDTAKAVAVDKSGPGSIIQHDKTKRYIYLTWDDSPQPPGTLNCKSVFQSEGIKATFFAVGFNQVGPAKRRIIDSIRGNYPQFLLANHSFTHGFRDKYGSFYSPTMIDSAYNDFMKNEKELKIPVQIIRLPGNNTWASNGSIYGQKAENPLIKKLDAAGYKIVGWDLEWGQQTQGKAPKESVDLMIKRINQKFEDESTYQLNSIVILSHDRWFEKKEWQDSLRKFVSVLKADGRYVFETIDHYPTVQEKK